MRSSSICVKKSDKLLSDRLIENIKLGSIKLHTRADVDRNEIEFR